MQTPEWLGAGLLTAALAALGYVLKSIIEGFVTWDKEQKRIAEERRTRLIKLHSLLRAGDAVFQTQVQLRNALNADLIATETRPYILPMGSAAEALLQQAGLQQEVDSRGHARPQEGYEARFAAAYPTLTDEQRELHSLIRAYTVHAMHPLNRAALDWLREDTYYKSLSNQQNALGEIARLLNHLEAHLVLWFAKYEVWIPNQEHHALVYLGDEKQHGIGFPKGPMDKATGKPKRLEEMIDDFLQGGA
jgi:hypothetical protein